MKRGVHIIVSGKVQGVSFRFNTIREARKWGIVGWVRNLDDGSVEIYAEGELDNLNNFIEWTRHGPSSAIVTDCFIEWKIFTGKFNSFELKY